ncbi:MAG: ATP-binding cassette domain-containing protein, partial [Candidatus Hydrogenedentes bacterium]|nr:ATP-binding cassette domain-containing protein [Candidatus Hydrogenedentota bacterium]
MNDVLIEVKHLVAHYGTTKILDDVSFNVRRGEIFMIIGGSGCGKSTLLKQMCGLLKPTSGEILFHGTNIVDMDEESLSEMQHSIGIAFQSSGLFNSMTVGDNVAMPMHEFGNIAKELIPPLVRLKLSLVGLEHALYQMPDELSGGMRKRAGLAR